MTSTELQIVSVAVLGVLNLSLWVNQKMNKKNEPQNGTAKMFQEHDSRIIGLRTDIGSVRNDLTSLQKEFNKLCVEYAREFAALATHVHAFKEANDESHKAIMEKLDKLDERRR